MYVVYMHALDLISTSLSSSASSEESNANIGFVTFAREG